MNAVVLGGGEATDPLAARFNVSTKSLIPISGQPMANFVLNALRPHCAHIVFVGPSNSAIDALVDETLPDQGSMLENLLLSLSNLPSDQRVLVCTADVPLISSDAVKSLLESDPGVGVVYPIVPRQASEAMFPGGKRTFVRLHEGQFTGGNLFLFEAGLAKQFMPRLRQVIARRKNPLALALLFGPTVIFKFLRGTLSILELENRVSHILGVNAQALITEHAEIGFDVDKPEDLAVVRRILEPKLPPIIGGTQ